jgi:hypothetical protein
MNVLQAQDLLMHFYLQREFRYGLIIGDLIVIMTGHGGRSRCIISWMKFLNKLEDLL